MFNKNSKNNEQENPDIELVNLKTTNNNYEISLIEGILNDNSIPYILKEKESGSYMKIIGGFSLYGTDILVEKNDFERANELILEILGNN